MYFTFAFEPLTVSTGASYFVIDIGETLSTKIAAVRCYDTQFPPEKEYVFDRIRGAALQCGASAGFAAGEMFVSTRAIGAPDMMQLLFPPLR